MKNKLFKQKSMTIWAKNFVEVRRQKDLYTYKKKVNGKKKFWKNFKLRPWTGWTLFQITISDVEEGKFLMESGRDPAECKRVIIILQYSSCSKVNGRWPYCITI